jgi:hypothetical protein
MKTGRVNRSTQRKPAPVPLCPPQIPHDQIQAQTQAIAVGSQQITAWGMVQSIVSELWNTLETPNPYGGGEKKESSSLWASFINIAVPLLQCHQPNSHPKLSSSFNLSPALLAFCKRILWLTVEFNDRDCFNQSENASFMILLYSTSFLLFSLSHYYWMCHNNWLCWKFHMNLSERILEKSSVTKKNVTYYTC